MTLAGGGNLTLSGTANYAGATTVSAGRLNVTGTIGATTAAGAIAVGTVANTPAVMSISNNITTSTTGNVFVGGATSAGGTSGANAVVAIYQTGGNFIDGWTGQGTQAFQLGAANAGYGYYSSAGGYMRASEFGIGGGGTDTAPGLNTGAVGVVDVTGGTMNSSGWIGMGHGGGQVSVLNVSVRECARCHGGHDRSCHVLRQWQWWHDRQRYRQRVWHDLGRRQLRWR